MKDDLEATAMSQRTFDRTIRVTVPASVLFNRDQMVKITDVVLGRLGCPACHSGWDIRFDMEKRFAFDEKLNLRSVEGGIIVHG